MINLNSQMDSKVIKKDFSKGLKLDDIMRAIKKENLDTLKNLSTSKLNFKNIPQEELKKSLEAIETVLKKLPQKSYTKKEILSSIKSKIENGIDNQKETTKQNRQIDKIILTLKNKNFEELENITQKELIFNKIDGEKVKSLLNALDMALKKIDIDDIKGYKTILNIKKLIQKYNLQESGTIDNFISILKSKNYEKLDIKNFAKAINLASEKELKAVVDLLDDKTNKNEKFLIIRDKLLQKLKTFDSFHKILNLSKSIEKAIITDLKNEGRIIKSFVSLKDNLKQLKEHFENNFSKEVLSTKIKNSLQDIENLTKEILSLKIKYLDKMPTLNRVEKELKQISKELEDIAPSYKENTNRTKIKKLADILKQTINSQDKINIKLLSKTNINSQLQNLTKELDGILKSIKNRPIEKNIIEVLQNFTKNIKEINLKENIENSGVFLESKIKNLISQESEELKALDRDLKTALLKIKHSCKEDTDTPLKNRVDKAINHIETLQLNSVATSNLSLFVPFSWDELKDGTITFSQSKNSIFSCKIDLNLQKDGKVDIFMLLNSNNISIGIDAKNEEFKKRLKENSNTLNEMLKSINLIPNIFFHKIKNSPYQSDENIDIGVDLKA